MELFQLIAVFSRALGTLKWTLLENYKKVGTGKNEQIFWKTVSVAASEKGIFSGKLKYKICQF